MRKVQVLILALALATFGGFVGAVYLAPLSELIEVPSVPVH